MSFHRLEEVSSGVCPTAGIITCATSEEADELPPGMNTTRYYLRNKTKSKEPKALGSKGSTPVQIAKQSGFIQVSFGPSLPMFPKKNGR
jgi:hypothetical protein